LPWGGAAGGCPRTRGKWVLLRTGGRGWCWDALLLAPPAGMVWEILRSSENPRYNGGGTAQLEGEAGWQIPGHAAVALWPMAREEHEEQSLPSC
jgi:hypothetical protein